MLFKSFKSSLLLTRPFLMTVFQPCRTTFIIAMKLWPNEQNFLRNTFKSNLHLSVASAHVQVTHSETWSDFADQSFSIWKQLLGFLGLETCCDLETFQIMSPKYAKYVD